MLQSFLELELNLSSIKMMLANITRKYDKKEEIRARVISLLDPGVLLNLTTDHREVYGFSTHTSTMVYSKLNYNFLSKIKRCKSI
jgi:hypothetical protein